MKELYLHASSRAFGDGQHPSTQLAAQLLQQQSYTTPPHMLDIGCGSGILSFIAATLWQAHVTACDIQPLAIDTTRHNAQENMLSEYIHAVQADGLNHPHIIQRAPYNLVCINILLEHCALLSAVTLITRARCQHYLLWFIILASRTLPATR